MYALRDPDVVFWSANLSLVNQYRNIAQNKWLFENASRIIFRYEGNFTVSFDTLADVGELETEKRR